MMKPLYLPIKGVLPLVLLSVALIGCAQTAPSRFYSLSALSDASSEGTPGTIENNISLGIGPLSLPDYLNRSEIVTRENQNEITLAEYDRWAGQLNDALLQVISENLAVLLSTDRIVTYPWRGSVPLDYQVGIEILQFDGKPGQRAVLIARWTVTALKNKEVVAMKHSSITESAVEAGYAGLVAAQSRAVAALSREISSVIKNVSQEGKRR